MPLLSSAGLPWLDSRVEHDAELLLGRGTQLAHLRLPVRREEPPKLDVLRRMLRVRPRVVKVARPRLYVVDGRLHIYTCGHT